MPESAAEQQNPNTTAPSATDIAKAVISQAIDISVLERIARSKENFLVRGSKIIIGLILGAFGIAGAKAAEQIIDGEEIAGPAFDRLMRTAFKDITGVDMGGGGVKGGRGSRASTAQSLGAALMTAVAGSTPGAGGGVAGIEPSQRPAEEYVTWVTQLAMEGWLTGLLGETFSLGQLEALGDLDDALANSLGLGRMTRRVMAPLLDSKVITPFRWQCNKTYRPELLSAGEVARQVARGRWPREKGIEELARQGWSDDRIEALFNAAAKFHSVGDVDLLMRAGEMSEGDAIKHLRDQGYTEEQATREVRLERIKRIAAFERSMANAAVDAYVRRDIERGQLETAAAGVTLKGQELAQLIELAVTKREFNVKRLSIGQVEQMVKSGVLNVIDYRRAAEREGYPHEDVMALELQLRYELQEIKNIELAREQLAKDRAAEKAKKDAELAKKRQQIAEDQALARRGNVATIERAVIRGIATMDRYVELLAPRYDADTVQLMVELVEEQRLAYVAEQQRREEALRRAESKGISLAQVEAAVWARQATIDDYRRRLDAEKINADDAELLVRTLQARLDDRAEAERKRAEAEREAGRRSIDLGRFEQLVRRGLRSLGEYDGLLSSLGYDAGNIAAMRELLTAQIADDERAREERRRAEERLRIKGVSPELMRRGVLLGVNQAGDYEALLLANGFTADAIAILMADLAAAVKDAEAARRRREEAESQGGNRELPLSTVARAARLGVVSPDAYEDRLRALGFNDADIAIEMDLLFLEIGNTQQARRERDAANAAAEQRGLSLAQVERAVKLGVELPATYRAKLAELGYANDAADVLMAVLTEELAQIEDARRRRDELAAGGDARALSLGQLEEAVKKNERTLDDYFAGALALGYAAADAELLTTLVFHEMEAKAAKG